MNVLQSLQAVQARCGCLPREEVRRAAAEAGVSEAVAVGAAEFYSYFSFTEDGTGEHIENYYPVRRKGLLLGSGAYDREKIFSMSAAEVINELKLSGLAGRSSGFPAGDKWELTAAQSGEKYVVCNADEGELFTGKDRAILECNPRAVIDGIALCARTVGAGKAFIYLRAEYGDLKEKLLAAIAEAGRSGEIEVRMGMGSYVCGEETALIASIEGARGETRLKPPFPGVSGLYGRPTVVSNVETLAWTPYIMDLGAGWFRSAGSADCCGPKIYTVTGCVKAAGVYELDGAVTLQDLLECAGGAAEEIAAVQTGGGSGAIEMPRLSADANSAGCGSVRFISRGENMVGYVINLIDFFAAESCGVCVPCRIGLQRVRSALSAVQSKTAEAEDIERLTELCRYIARNSRCTLGRAAVTPVLSLLQNFSEAVQ
ncbi:MAG: NADH-quinone oxidoreductase subunit F [Oscillospiraceae bacterium]|nr:NADH-quinone oxidoreductase subunit F [Oscillospiraceae bacterium]